MCQVLHATSTTYIITNLTSSYDNNMAIKTTTKKYSKVIFLVYFYENIYKSNFLTEQINLMKEKQLQNGLKISSK